MIVPSVILLPLVFSGRITHEEADIICKTVDGQEIPDTTRGIQEQFEKILGRKI